MVKVYYRTNEAFERSLFLHLFEEEGVVQLDRPDYREVTEFPGGTTFESVFRQMNVVNGDELPVRLKVRSMSAGDAVEDGDELWLCDMVGWRRATWR